MEYTQFIELPVETKIRIINKCRPKSYIRFRRTCRFADEFCEKNRKYLGVYCDEYDGSISISYQHQHGYHYVLLRDGTHKNSIESPVISANTSRINKAVPGFAFHEFDFRNYRNEKSYDNVINYFLKTVPDFKVSCLEFDWLTVDQVQRVMSSKWKIGGVKIRCQLEMWKILKIDAIRKKDPAWYVWEESETDFRAQDIVELVRGKKNISIQPNFLSTSALLNVFSTIIQNWKEDGEYPKNFYTDWSHDKQYMDVNISGFYSEIIGMEALHLGSFWELHKGGYGWKTKNDIWIKMDENTKQWQFVLLMRTDLEKLASIEFRFKSGFSYSELFQKLIKFLEEIYDDFIFDYSTLYETYHVTKDLEKFKEAFVKIVPKKIEYEEMYYVS